MSFPRGEVRMVTSLVTSTRCAERLSESDPALRDGLQTRHQGPGINGESLKSNNKFFIRSDMTWRQILVNKQYFYPKLIIIKQKKVCGWTAVQTAHLAFEYIALDLYINGLL